MKYPNNKKWKKIIVANFPTEKAKCNRMNNSEWLNVSGSEWRLQNSLPHNRTCNYRFPVIWQFIRLIKLIVIFDTNSYTSFFFFAKYVICNPELYTNVYKSGISKCGFPFNVVFAFLPILTRCIKLLFTIVYSFHLEDKRMTCCKKLLF